MPEVGGVAPPQAGLPGGSPSGKGTPPAPLPAQGTVVEAEVLRAPTPGEGWVRLGGRVLLARFPAHLPEGAKVDVRVEGQGPPIQLRLVSGPDASAGRLMRPPPVSLADTLRTLVGLGAADGPDAGPGSAILSSFPSGLDPQEVARFLSRWLRGSGVFHEALLAQGEVPDDLKTLALRWLARLPEGSLSRVLDALVRHIEAHQARSLSEGLPVVPLALPWGEGWVQGELRIEHRRGRGGQRGGTVTVNLDLPRLGRTQVRVGWGAIGVSVRIAVPRERVTEVEGRLGELAEALEGPGRVRLVSLGATALEPPASPHRPTVEIRA